MRAIIFATAIATTSLLGSIPAFAQRVDWANTSGDPGAMRYAPVADIDRNNVGRLKLAWRWNSQLASVLGPVGVAHAAGDDFGLHRQLSVAWPVGKAVKCAKL